MTKLSSVMLLWIAAFFALPASGITQESLVTDRPDFTESASVPGGGRIQIEGGWTVEGDGDARAHSLGEILVRIGVGERFEARIERLTWISADGGDGADDVDGLDDAGI